MMQIDIELHDGPLPATPCWSIEGAGAVIRFEGVVRPEEGGRRLEALMYECYEPMTTTELRRLAEQVAGRHGVLGLQVMHSYGEVPIGAVSFRLDVASKHRVEGIAAMDEFINRLKREVPLWKVPVYVNVEGKAIRSGKSDDLYE